MTQSAETFYARVFALFVAALLGFALLRIVQPFVGPILWAALLAFLLFPAYERLRRRLGKRQGLAPLLMTLAVTLGIVVPVAILVVTFAGQATDLIDRLTRTADRYQISQPQDVLRLPFLQNAVRWLADNVPVTVDQLQEWVVDGLRTALEFALANSRFVFLGALGAFVGLTLMLFILYFFFRDGREIAQRSLALVPLTDEHRAILIGHLSQVTRAVVYGSVLTALLQGALVGVAFAITGLPSPVVFGVIAAVASLVPVVGTGVVVVPAAIVLAAQGRWGMAVFMAVWGVVVVGLADNFVRPLFISGRAEISTLPVFIGVLGGLAAFGPIGLFLGPVVIALALALVRFAEESRSSRKPAAAASRR